jgi:hypothetical protein
MVNELARLQEPWEVIKHPDCFQVVDATGRFIQSVSHRQDLHRGGYPSASNRSARPGNLSQWKPQCACPATYRKSGPVQSPGNNFSAARTEDEIPELFVPFGRPRPSWRTFHFPSPFSPSAIVLA